MIVKSVRTTLELCDLANRAKSIIENADKEFLTWGMFDLSPGSWCGYVNRQMLLEIGEKVLINDATERLVLEYLAMTSKFSGSSGFFPILGGLLFSGPLGILTGIANIAFNEKQLNDIVSLREEFQACKTLPNYYSLKKSRHDQGIVLVYSHWYTVQTQYGGQRTNSFPGVNLNERDTEY